MYSIGWSNQKGWTGCCMCYVRYICKLRTCRMLNQKSWEEETSVCVTTQCSKWAGIPYRKFFLFLNFIQSLSIYLFSISVTAHPCFAFVKHTGTSKFPFWALFLCNTKTEETSVRVLTDFRWIRVGYIVRLCWSCPCALSITIPKCYRVWNVHYQKPFSTIRLEVQRNSTVVVHAPHFML
jgi:hypothetical protein